jgi:hypoxanthine phosphoribosyltransferase
MTQSCIPLPGLRLYGAGMDAWLGIGGFLVGIVGIVLTIYYAQQAQRLNKMRKRLEWADLQAAASDLGQRMKHNFAPAVVVTPGLTGATFANLLVTEFPNQPPVLVGTRTWKDDPHAPVLPDDSIVIDTKKWIVTIPRKVLLYQSGKILIVDDFVMSGDFLDLLKARMVEAGIDAARIVAASIVVTKVAIKNRKSPDYYWWVADDDDFFFPWGKAK